MQEQLPGRRVDRTPARERKSRSRRDAAMRALYAIVEATRDAGFVVAVAIVDAHGDLVAARRMDGTPPRWMRASLRKAYSAPVMDRDTEAFGNEIIERKLQIGDYRDPMLTALPGGITVSRPDGTTLARIGVTGKTDAATPNSRAATLRRSHA